MNPQTIEVLTTTAVGFLSAYLAKVGEAVTKKVGEDIYQVLKTRLSKKPAAREALADLEKSPNEADFQAALRVQLKKLLIADKTLALQLRQLLEKAGETKSGTIFIKQIAGDGATQIGLVHGDVTLNQD